MQFVVVYGTLQPPAIPKTSFDGGGTRARPSSVSTQIQTRKLRCASFSTPLPGFVFDKLGPVLCYRNC